PTPRWASSRPGEELAAGAAATPGPGAEGDHGTPAHQHDDRTGVTSERHGRGRGRPAVATDQAGSRLEGRRGSRRHRGGRGGARLVGGDDRGSGGDRLRLPTVEQRLRVDGGTAVRVDLEVAVRAGGVAGGPDEADDLAPR